MKKEEARAKGLFGKCPFATAQQLLKGKWAIMIMHELADGTKRFKKIQRDIDITQATLTNQLRYMEEEGLVSRKVYPEVPPRVEYSLTEIGREFIPVLDAIQQWSPIVMGAPYS
jgi:DNA-binding HxlR family transcriptional regulator